MALYTLAFPLDIGSNYLNAAGAATLVPVLELLPGGSNAAALVEMEIIMKSPVGGLQPVFCLARTPTPGVSPFPNNLKFAAMGLDRSVTPAITVGTNWVTPPAVPTHFNRRITMGAGNQAGASVVRWRFNPGLTFNSNASLVLCMSLSQSITATNLFGLDTMIVINQ